jgi:hypothetical protein
VPYIRRRGDAGHFIRSFLGVIWAGVKLNPKAYENKCKNSAKGTGSAPVDSQSPDD